MYNNYPMLFVSQMASCSVEDRFDKEYKRIKVMVTCEMDIFLLK